MRITSTKPLKRFQKDLLFPAHGWDKPDARNEQNTLESEVLSGSTLFVNGS
jgi:hypothetical protein